MLSWLLFERLWIFSHWNLKREFIDINEESGYDEKDNPEEVILVKNLH